MEFDKPVIVFTLDLDWVGDEVLEWTIDLFKDHGLPVTLFATHKTELLENREKDIELGIHPNFFNHPNHGEHIEELLAMYPDVKAVRSHGLFEYSNLMNLYRERGLLWDSSQLLYLCQNIQPYRHPSGLTRLPIFWEDDDYLSQASNWMVEKFDLETPGVKCFDFHPIHLRLNSYIPSQYSSAKEGNLSSKAIRETEYKGLDKGVLVFFRRLCDFVRNKNLAVSSLSEVCESVQIS